MAFSLVEDRRKQCIGQCKLLSRPAKKDAIISQVCCLNDHIGLVYQNNTLELHNIHKQSISRRISDTVHLTRIIHDDSIIFLTTFGSVHYLSKPSDTSEYSDQDTFLMSITSNSEELKTTSQIEMQFDYSKSLLVIYALGAIHILNTNIKSLVDDPTAIPTVFTSDRYEIADRVLPSMFSKSVSLCRFWGKGNSCGIVFSSNSETIEMWPIHATSNSHNDLIEWRRRRERPVLDMSLGGGMGVLPAKRIERTIQSDPVHSTWVSALSMKAPHHHESNYSVYASGDESGTTVFWLLEELHADVEQDLLAAGPSLDTATHQLHRPGHIKLSKIAVLANNMFGNYSSSVTSIVSFGDEGFWIGFSTGDVALVTLDPANYKVTKQRCISTQCAGGITDFMWQRLQQENSYKLWAISKHDGQVVEYILHHGVNNIQMLWPNSFECLTDYLFDELDTDKEFENHKSNIEVCDLCTTLNLLVCASSNGLISVWNINHGKLVCHIKCTENSICALRCCGGRNNSDEGIVVISGCRNGHVFEHFVALPAEYLTECRTEHTNSPDEYSADLQNKLTGSILDSLDSQSIASSPSKYNVLSRAKGGKSFISSVVVKNLSYSPLPVSDILLSLTNDHAAFCFARIYLVIHSRKEHKVILQMQFDSVLKSVSIVSSMATNETNMFANDFDTTRKDDVKTQDKLVLALQGPVTLKIFDALEHRLDGEIKISMHGRLRSGTDYTITQSTLWALPESRSSNSNHDIESKSKRRTDTIKQSYSGVAIVNTAEDGPKIFQVDSDGIASILDDQIECIGGKESKLRKLVCGWSIQPKDNVHAFWSYRDALIVQSAPLQSGHVDRILAISCHIEELSYRNLRCKSRIVFCQGLPSNSIERKRRFLLVLSDGFCVIVNM